MDLELQRNILALAKSAEADELVVLLGSGSADSAGIYAETVTVGDPTYAGPLAGVQLGLQVMHVFEPEVGQDVDPALYDAEISVLAMALERDAIVEEMRRIRSLADG